ncbi:MAG: hypothetical protein QM703_23395 [Gemmatales bacterium]
MKYLAWSFRIIVVVAGITLCGLAGYLAWPTIDILKINWLPKSERVFQETRLGAHVIAFVLGLALVVLAIPRRRKEPLPSPPPKAVKYRIFFGVLFFIMFIFSCLRYIRDLGRDNFKPDDDIAARVIAVLFWMFVAVTCFKWKSTPAKNSESDSPG